MFTSMSDTSLDILPDSSGDKRGWWADTSDDKIGSKLWLLMRTGTTADISSRAEKYIKECLDWMIVDGLAKSIDVIAERSGNDTLLITIQIFQPDGKADFYKYSFK